jgi:hypothetical protein
VKIGNLVDLFPVADDLNVRMIHGVPLPDGITESEARKIVDIAHQAIALTFKPREIGRFLTKDFLAEVLTNMQKAVEGKQPYRFMLYAAHDVTLLPVMSALGVPLDYETPYASNISFELYKDGDAYSVLLRYNGNDVVLPDTGGKPTCTFDQFKLNLQGN